MAIKYAGENPLDRLRPQEPYFFVRAQDRLAMTALTGYRDGLLRVADGLGPDREALAEHLRAQARDVAALMAYFEAWQQNHPDLLKMPD